MSRGRDHLIVALDLPERERIVELATQLREYVAMVKVGLEAYVAHGPDLVRALIDRGLEVFLDLKLHDIPRTAAAAARQASRLGVRLLTIHAAGGAEMIRAVREDAHAKTQVIAVTMLTSLDDSVVSQLGFRGSVAATARDLGALAMSSGADGLVCSTHELAALRGFGGVRVVPGVRPVGAEAGDQKRVATPQEAVSAGATWIVVGRPILFAPEPVAMAREIGESL